MGEAQGVLMDAEFKSKWVAELRSGKYKQTKHYLRTQNGYCCLGVACDTHDPSEWQDPIPGFNGFPYGGDCFSIPSYTRKLYNISEKLCNQLIEMNDKGKTFEEIAAYIEGQA